MPWNEPGGNNNEKDPWSGRSKRGSKGNSSGTDNVEELTRKLNEKVSSIFGGKSNNGDGNNGDNWNGINKSGALLIGAILLGIWLLTGFYTVDSAQRGVELRFGAYQQTTQPGLHWHLPYPVETVELVDVDKNRMAKDRTHMLTKDENIVDVGVSVQYKIKAPEDYLFNVYLADYERQQSVGTLYHVMRSAVREVIGRNTMDGVLKDNRAGFAPDTLVVMQEILDSYKSGLHVIKVNLTYAEAPKQVKDAFDDANRAREDKDKYKNQAETYEKKVIPAARGQAARIIEDATAYTSQIISKAMGDSTRFEQLAIEYHKAPEVTRQRLYLETMEEVMSNNQKIMIDSKSGNNLLYLPLDKLQGSSNSSGQTLSPAIASAVQQRITNKQDQNSRTSSRSTSREARQ
ncbi:MAG TPA: FtsH protease activity modulator HflK [Gammaproteobacteria bacterium]|nr:FtsH protease activity modulator HflK [Gammaproteobacteria bacterium]